MFTLFEMSSAHAQHYNLDNTTGRTKLVLDTWKNQAMIIDNDVLPESKECPVIPGFENTANTLSKNGAHFTTVPLNPMSRDVNFLYQNYITIKFELTFDIDCGAGAGTINEEGRICIFTPSTAMLPSRIMLLSGNSILWNNQYQREEAIVTMCSLPQGVVSKSCDYTTLSKLINKENYPGFTFEADANLLTLNNGHRSVKVRMSLNIDVNQLSPILSNIVYTTPDMGSLRLRLFFDDLEKAFSWCYIPYCGDLATQIKRNYIQRIPLDYAYNLVYNANNVTVRVSLKDWSLFDEGITITQSCFGIRDESKIEMKKYIAQDNKLIIPTQCWSCSLSSDYMTPNNNGTLTFNVTNYNVAVVAFLFPSMKNNHIYKNPVFTSLNVKYNSKSLNYVPYGLFDKRLIKDTVQALINDDFYAVNENLFDSVAPSIFNANFISKCDDTTANPRVYAPIDMSYFDITKNTRINRSSGCAQYNKLPNLYTVAFNVSPVNTFEKGFSVASSNEGVIQIRVDYQLCNDALIKNIYCQHGQIANLNTIDTSFPVENVQALCLCLCDCCLVLDYNPIVGSAQTGSVVFAEPFVV